MQQRWEPVYPETHSPVSHVTLSRKLKVRFQYLGRILLEVEVMEEEEARGKQDVLWNLGKTAVQ